ncbi:hypothetical protein E4U13_006328 [Claviceps humidiphila]|uniref:BZIP domain-containing protein n=1 Tax=Claviceps humidiphila TaxID=1294629 RepID=A0A9P7PU85_9HYPO|nr:hypothetical protein E4U13_006328 [Claviceps humidiphila]
MPSMTFLSKAPPTDTGAYFNSLWTNVALYEASIGLTDASALPFDFGNGNIVGLPPDQQSCSTPIPSMSGVIAPTNCPNFCGETFQNFQWNDFSAAQVNIATFTPTVLTPADPILMQCHPGGPSHLPSDGVSRRQRQSHLEFNPLSNDESPPHTLAQPLSSPGPDQRPKTRSSDKPGRRRAGVRKRSVPSTSTRSKGVAASGSQADSSNARERNRLAASGYRKRVKKHAEQLKLTNQDTEKLLAERDELAREVVQLKDQLLLHATCQDRNIDAWIARAAESYTRKLSLDR